MSKLDLPHGWCYVKISDISIKGQQRQPIGSEKFLYVDISSIDRDLKAITTPQELLGKDAPSRARKIINKGDILVSLVRPNLNTIAIVPPEFDNQIASTGFEVIKPILVNSNYIFYVLCTDDFISYISKAVKGALYPAVNSSDIQSYQLPLAPQKEQDIICKLINEFLIKINETKLQINNIKNMLRYFSQSVLTSAIDGSFKPNYDLKVNFKKIKLKDLTTKIGSGSTPKGGSHSYKNSGMPFVRSQNIYTDYIKMDDLAYIDDAQAQKLSQVEILEDDVLINLTGASIGRVNIAPKEFIGGRVNQHVSIIRCNKDKLLPKYLHIYLSSPRTQEWIENENYGATRQALTKSMLENLTLELPSIDDQKNIVDYVEECLSYSRTISQKIENLSIRLDILTQSVFAKAFSGELTAKWRAEQCGAIDKNDDAKYLIKKISDIKNKEIKNNVKRKYNPKENFMTNNKIITVFDALSSSQKPLSSQQLLEAAGYPNDSSAELLERFFLDIRNSLNKNLIKKEKRDNDGQDWFKVNN